MVLNQNKVKVSQQKFNLRYEILILEAASTTPLD